MADQTNAEVSDERLREAWPLCGYAPGNYSCRCHTCDKQFVGDKRATTCLECAVIEAKVALNRRSVTSQASEGAGRKLVPSAERWPALNVTTQELIRIKNTCVGKEGNVKIWSKMLWIMIEYILDVRAFEKEFQSSPQGETPSLTTSAVPASDEAMTKGGEAPASPPDPESIASYYASIWGLSNHKLNQLTDGLRKWRKQIEAASPSKRVERLETALTDVLREATTAKPFGSHTLPPDLLARLQALQGGRS